MDDDLRRQVSSAARRLLYRSVVAVGAMLTMSAWAWVRIPAGKLVPIHWGLSFQVDAYTSKSFGLFWMPGLGVAISALLVAVLLLSRSENLARSTKAYVAASTAILALLLGVHVAIVLVAVGLNIDMRTVVVSMVGGMFVVLGNYMGKIRRNRWMGVRTRWTRSSDLCWRKTHRLASRLFVGLGLALIAAALGRVRPEHTAVILIVGTVGVTLWVYIYSYVVWRAEQHNQM